MTAQLGGQPPQQQAHGNPAQQQQQQQQSAGQGQPFIDLSMITSDVNNIFQQVGLG